MILFGRRETVGPTSDLFDFEVTFEIVKNESVPTLEKSLVWCIEDIGNNKNLLGA